MIFVDNLVKFIEIQRKKLEEKSKIMAAYTTRTIE